MKYQNRLLLGLLIIFIPMIACSSSELDSITNAITPTITWPFQSGSDQWAIVNGYRGAFDHAPNGSPNNYALYAFDFAKCLPANVSADQTTCDLSSDQWSATTGSPVYAPVSGSVGWAQESCRAISFDIDNNQGYRVTLAHVDLLPGLTWSGLQNNHTHFNQGDQIGTVSDAGCIGSGNHIHMALYSCTNCSSDPAGERVGHPFDGMWAIGGCSYADDQTTTNQHRGTLVPC